MTPVTETTSDVISSERVEGTNVYNKAGEKLGSIDDVSDRRQHVCRRQRGRDIVELQRAVSERLLACDWEVDPCAGQAAVKSVEERPLTAADVREKVGRIDANFGCTLSLGLYRVLRIFHYGCYGCGLQVELDVARFHLGHIDQFAGNLQ